MQRNEPGYVVVAHWDAPMRHYLAATLSVAGFAVEPCLDRRAFERAAAHADALVVDARLDGMRPDAVARLCAELAPEAPVVFVCGARQDVASMLRPEKPSLKVLEAPFGPRKFAGAVAEITAPPTASG